MPETRKRKRESVELARKKRITAEMMCLFDSDDDTLVATAASNMSNSGANLNDKPGPSNQPSGPVQRPSQTIDSSSGSESVSVKPQCSKPPPPKRKAEPDGTNARGERLATASDID